MLSTHTENLSTPSVPQTAGESKLWKDVNVAEQIGLKMAKSKWLEAQHALKRNSLRKDNPQIRFLTHFTHSLPVLSLQVLHTGIVKPWLPDCLRTSHRTLLIQPDHSGCSRDAHIFLTWKLHTEISLRRRAPQQQEPRLLTLSTSMGTWAAGGKLMGTLTLMAGVWAAVVCGYWEDRCLCCSRRSCSWSCSRMSCCRSRMRDVTTEELSGGLEETCWSGGLLHRWG